MRCTRGAIYDVALDIRSGSPTFGQWVAVELAADNHRMLYIPEGCAHGYQTFVDDTEVCYQSSEFYSAEHVHGVRYDDPAFAIDWSLPVASISDSDRSWPNFQALRVRGCVQGAARTTGYVL